MTHPRHVALLTVGAFLAVRLPLLLADPLWGTMEQHEFGLFAVHLLTGLVAAPAAYLPQQHQGCTFLFGALAAPIMAVGGPDVGSLRLASLLLHAGIAAVFATLAARAGGLRAGLVAGLLLVFAPPMLVHFAHKGSTNHDDADLFVGLAILLLAGRPGRRPGVRGLLVGALTALAGAYLFDGAIRAVAAGVVVLALGPRPTRREALGFASGLSAVTAAAWGLGVRIGGSTAVGHAMLATPLRPRFGRGQGLLSVLATRGAELLRVGLPRTFQGAHTSTPTPGSLGSWFVDWGYLLALLVLIALGMAGRSRGGVVRRRVAWACAAAVGIQLLAVLVSSVDVDANYLAPIWPYLVVLGSLAFARAAPRAPQGVGALAIAALLGLSVPAMWSDLGWPFPPWGEGGDGGAREQARFAHSLRAGRLADHQLAGRLLAQHDDAHLLRLIDQRPAEALDLARLLGRAAAEHLTATRCSDERGDALGGLDGALRPGQRTAFWEGVGEGLVRWPAPCDPLPILRLPDGPNPLPAEVDPLTPLFSGSSEVESAARALFARPGVDPDALVLGMAEGLLFERDGEFEGLQRLFPEGRSRRLFCAAAGGWAYEWLRVVELTDWLDGRGICALPDVALGWGVALARDQPPAGSPVEPRYRWWWTDASAAEVRAFQCAWRAEREVVEDRSPQGGWPRCRGGGRN